MNEKTKAALIGGVILGILSVIPFINSCCCLWAIGGGLLAGYLYFSKLPSPATAGDGAMLGLLTGVIGAIIYVVLSIPFALLSGAANYQQALRQLHEQNIDIPPAIAGLGTVGIALLFSIIGAVVLIILAALGGLIAAPLFGRKVAPPPPPTNYGGMR
jgi:hypothetical protein